MLRVKRRKEKERKLTGWVGVNMQRLGVWSSSTLRLVVCSVDSDRHRCCQDPAGVKKKKTYLLGMLASICRGWGCGCHQHWAEVLVTVSIVNVGAGGELRRW